MKSVLLSIQPKWCELIASGEKTIEIRKTKPKIETPFKCYIYQTKHREHNGHTYSDGKVIGEFICDDIKWNGTSAYVIREECIKALEGSCLTEDEFHSYMNYPPLNPYQDLKEALKKYEFYGWHISDIVIYDKPKCLGNFNHCGDNYHFNPPVMKPPQSWCYVEELEDER